MNQRFKHLFRKYLDNSCSREEFDELFAYMEQQGDQNSLDGLLESFSEKQEPIESLPGKRLLPRIAVAASILVVLSGAVWWFSQQRSLPVKDVLNNSVASVTTISRSTEKSEYKYLLLPDSTQVWLNADSKLDFPENFDNKKRIVHLKGEAYFDVRHADKIPFIIYTGEVSTEVLGTAFNIKAYPDMEKITVSVKRGKVKVNYANKQVAVLTKGKEVVIGNLNKEAKEKPVKEELTAGWQEGNLVYDDYKVGDILADLERVYDVDIKVGSPELKELRVTTTLKRQYGVESALEILSRLIGTEITINNGSYIIKK
ncbi:FecR family protein [Flavihumibacter sp. UBA7668]|uniref:FecR family protein n=1 Tax=Flavihumibacter sp. UBA7668 TaxID=1946542 RepID=UPI0025C2BF09|nr:FecR domain-containing protein [Flavihumibacter sp. UBA7668]